MRDEYKMTLPDSSAAAAPVSLSVFFEKVQELSELVQVHERLIHQLEGRIDRAEAGLEWAKHLEEVGDDT